MSLVIVYSLVETSIETNAIEHLMDSSIASS